MSVQIADAETTVTLMLPEDRRLPGWGATLAVAVPAAAGLLLFFLSLRGVELTRMNGMGLISVLPAGAIAGVVIVALAYVFGLALPRAYPAVLAPVLIGLVVALDGLPAFLEQEPHFPTSYQIAGFVSYVGATGHTAPGLAGYFSWPGFFALISFVSRAAGTQGLLTLLRVWPTFIDLLYLPAFFLVARGLRISWRARWLGAFLFVFGNWVGQDYFSPQSFNFLLYLLFVGILINWFVDPNRTRKAPFDPGQAFLRRRRFLALRGASAERAAASGRKSPGGFWARRRSIPLRPGELTPRVVSTGQRVFLLILVIGIFTVSTTSHQLTPFFMLGACVALVLTRRFTLPGLPVLLGVILAGFVSFATVDYWSGHRSDIFGALGDLGSNFTNSVGGRIAGSSPTHEVVLHARLLVAAAIIGLAVLGLIRRRWIRLDDRVLLALLCVPVAMVVIQSYGGEIGLRIYLFMLPAACLLAACCFFPEPEDGGTAWASRWGRVGLAALVGCAMVLPVGFLLARYGNEAFEQVPPGELAAANWVYAHDAGGVRLLWLTPPPTSGATPEMPWSYKDLSKVDYIAELAPRDPSKVQGVLSALRSAGPGSYLIVTRTQLADLGETASYEAGWGQRFEARLSASPGVKVSLANASAVVYTMHWPAGTAKRPFTLIAPGPGGQDGSWTRWGLVVLWALLALLALRELTCVRRPRSRLIRLCTVAALPLLLLLAADVVLRFVVVS